MTAKLPIYLSPIPDVDGMEGRIFRAGGMIRGSVSNPLLAFVRQVLSRVMVSHNLFLILVTLLWPQKELFADLLVEEPLKLYMLWNLRVQPHVRKFHKEL